MSRDLDALAINTIRGLSMDAVQAANSGHPGTPMALAPLGHVLFSRVRKHDPKHPEWPNRDRFVLSCGHASMLQYALLNLSGYDVSLDDIRSFRQWGSRTPGHPEYGHTPGVETTTGPLGQGVGNGVGMAMAEQHLARRFNRPGHVVVDHRVWVIASDGDLMEGVAAEASSLAGHLGLGKLTVFWDDNRITIDGTTEVSFTEDVLKRYEAYGWHVLSVDDGNDLAALEKAARAAEKETGRPTLVRVRTVIGFPSPNKSNSPAAHGAPLGTEEVALTKAAMEWPTEPFHFPNELKAVAREVCDRGARDRAAWEKEFSAYEKAHPGLAREFQDAVAGRLPEGWDAGLSVAPADPKGTATRQASGKVLAALSERIGNLVGGSCDLAGSNNSWQKGKGTFGDPEGTPNNVHFGVREHGMGAILNGMALHGGVVPYGATFLVFADYMRGSIRLAALMGLPVRYIFTHDSIGLGEDGPTHQPVEHLASLRAIPGLTVIRPADANETRAAWQTALRLPGPCALVLTRQNVPTLEGDGAGLCQGAYVLDEATGGSPRAVLFASGSEVSIAREARVQLEREGCPTRVVSVPSWELFWASSSEYQERVLGPTGATRAVVEAGIRQGWERFVGADGVFITLDRFGASAPYQTLYRELGISVDAVVAGVWQRLG